MVQKHSSTKQMWNFEKKLAYLYINATCQLYKNYSISVWSNGSIYIHRHNFNIFLADLLCKNVLYNQQVGHSRICDLFSFLVTVVGHMVKICSVGRPGFSKLPYRNALYCCFCSVKMVNFHSWGWLTPIPP